MTGPEIAEVTGLTLANVHQILSRAMRTLRDELIDVGLDERSKSER
jgi:DNA-directed RNA polymerase specialized sigma24 family protein